ncbi:MAG: aspartate carbamoyltransferase [Ardenticatenaceae bacterium]|nr:aspartate carbamoyltransferase [Ardenticatenaceae bacterium]
MTNLVGKDILAADQFNMAELELILQTARQFDTISSAGGTLDLMRNMILATLFYEPSTRTRLSFESAILRLGGSVLSVAEAKTSSSAAKGETLYDTGKMIEGYAHVAVIRHPIVGSARELADGASIPVINGGDGAGQHPSQALLDLYTIQKEKGRLEELTVTLVGDLRYGRTVHSLAPLLQHFGTRFNFVAPSELAMPAEITAGLRAKGAEVTETSDLAAVIGQTDVLYVTRIQKERFADPAQYEALKGAYVVNNALLQQAKPDLTIMHPLPRVDEIAKEVDAYEGAAYFRQAANGVLVRMALLALVTGKI